MAVDILNLGFKVDTAQVRTASKDLDNLSRSAKSSSASLNKFEKDADKASKSSNSLAASAKGLGAAYIGMAAASALGKAIDEYTKYNAQLKLATRNTAEYSKALQDVRRIAETAQVSIGSMATLYARLNQSLRDFGVSQATVSKITENVGLSLKISGASAGEASSAMLQLSQAFGSGVLRGEEFNAMMESAPSLMRALAESIGVPIGQLRSMAADGKITGDVLAKAFGDEALLAKFRAQAREMQTIGGAFQVLKNTAIDLAGTFAKQSGLVTLFTTAVNDLGSGLSILAGIKPINIKINVQFPDYDNYRKRMDEINKDLKNIGAKDSNILRQGSTMNQAAPRIDIGNIGDVTKATEEYNKLKSVVGELQKTNPLKDAVAAQREYATNLKTVNDAENKGILSVQEAARYRTQLNDQLVKGTTAKKTELDTVLKNIAALERENVELAKGATTQDAKTIAQLKADGATKQMIDSMLTAMHTNEKLVASYKETEDFFIDFEKSVADAVKTYDDLIAGLEKSIQAQKDENDVSRGLAKSVEELSIARLEERKIILDGLGLATADLEREIELRKQLSSEMEYKKVLDAEKKSNEDKIKEAEKVADDLKKINDKVAEDFNKSLTDAIFRGFESGKSFAKTFKDSLINSFKTLVLRPIVSFIVDSSGIAKVMGAITGGVSGTANAGGVDGMTGATSSIWQGITQGFDTANIAFEQSIQKFGTWVTSFGTEGSALTNLGGAISEYSGAISQALPYAGSVIKLLQGDFVGAAFTTAGTAIGSALGGPIGGAIGSFIGGAVGGLFGGGAKTYRSQVESQVVDGQFTANKATGAGSRLLKGADQPLIQLSQAFASTLGGLFKAASLDVDMNLVTQIGQKKRSWASFTATIGDEVFKTVTGANKGGLEKTLQTLVGKTFSDVMIKAIEASDLQEGIKGLFDGLTDQDQITQMSQAAQSLMKEFGSMAGAVAEIAAESTDSAESLLQFIDAINGVKTGVSDAMYSLMTPAEQAAMMLSELGTIFGSLNVAVPNSIAELQALAKSIDYTTKAGLTLAAAMPQLVAVYTAAQQAAEQVVASAKANTANARQVLVEAFNVERDRLQNIIDNVKESESALRDAFDTKALGIQDTITKFKNFGDSIRAFRQSLGERVASNSNPLLAVRTRFDAVSALALSGNEEALGSIQDASNDYLSAFEQYSGSFIDYQRAFANVSETLLAVENSSFSTASVAQLQLDSLKAQVGSLVSLNDTAKTIEQLMGEFNLAQELSTSAQFQLTALNSQQISLLGSIDGGIVNLATALASYQSAISAELSAVGSLNAAKTAASNAAAAIQAPVAPKISIAGMKSGDLVKIISLEGGGSDAWRAAMTDIKAGGDKVTVASVQDYIRTNLGDKYYANGGVFTNGIVDSPTAFNVGMMGEAGSEAIMPLTNMGGRLGVTTNNSEMVKQLTIISEKMSRLEAAQIATVQNTGKVARIIERADNGDSLNVMVVT